MAPNKCPSVPVHPFQSLLKDSSAFPKKAMDSFIFKLHVLQPSVQCEIPFKLRRKENKDDCHSKYLELPLNVK